MYWILQHVLSLELQRIFALKKKKIKTQFSGLVFFFIYLFLTFFKYRKRQIISIKSLSLTIISNLSSVQCSSCSFKFLSASVRI